MAKLIAALDQGTTSTRCIIFNQSGEIVGNYERVVEFGGDSGREQVMIVYMH